MALILAWLIILDNLQVSPSYDRFIEHHFIEDCLGKTTIDRIYDIVFPC